MQKGESVIMKVVAIVFTLWTIFGSVCGQENQISANLPHSCRYEIHSGPWRPTDCTYVDNFTFLQSNCTKDHWCLFNLPDGQVIWTFTCKDGKSFCDDCPKAKCEREPICVWGKGKYCGTVFRMEHCRCPMQYVSRRPSYRKAPACHA